MSQQMNPTERITRNLITSVLRFLKQEADQSPPDKKESLEVAIQCLESAYELEYAQGRNDPDPEDLLTIYTRATQVQQRAEISQKEMTEAEEHKNKGNDLMRGGLYNEAVEFYTKAIMLNPTNAVYFCNRAAAHSRLDQHENVIKDCEQAVKLDPNYGKAYGRLGVAYSNLNMHKNAKEAYLKAASLDPSNSMYQENLKLAEERMLSNNPDEAAAGNPGNMELGQFMHNPNLLNMASQMLSDPGVRDVMSGILQMGSGGGNPNIDALLQMGQQLAEQMQINNPSFVDNLRRQFGNERSSSEGQGEGQVESNNSTNNDAKKDEPPARNTDGDDSA